MGFTGLTGYIESESLSRLRRPVGRMTVEEQRYEGEFRFVNSRLITNSEEVAFYQGNKREQRNVDHAFNKLVRPSQINWSQNSSVELCMPLLMLWQSVFMK